MVAVVWAWPVGTCSTTGRVGIPAASHFTDGSVVIVGSSCGFR